MRAALLLLALVAGASMCAALPSNKRLLRSRRALQEADPEAPFPIQTFWLNNTCTDSAVAVRTFFQLDGDFAENWFSSDVTDYIPRPFVDWWCDNFPFSGEINFQMGDESKAAEPEVLAALRDGACLNEDVLLRPAGYQGRGPQPELDLQWPNGTVTGVWVTLAGSPDEAGSAPETDFALTEDSYEAVVFRTPDFGEECAQDDDDCLPWYQVPLDTLEAKVTLQCTEEAAGGKA